MTDSNEAAMIEEIERSGAAEEISSIQDTVSLLEKPKANSLLH